MNEYTRDRIWALRSEIEKIKSGNTEGVQRVMQACDTMISALLLYDEVEEGETE